MSKHGWKLVVLVEPAVLLATVHNRPFHGEQRVSVQLQGPPMSWCRQTARQGGPEPCSTTCLLELCVHGRVVRGEEYLHLCKEPNWFNGLALTWPPRFASPDGLQPRR